MSADKLERPAEAKPGHDAAGMVPPPESCEASLMVPSHMRHLVSPIRDGYNVFPPGLEYEGEWWPPIHGEIRRLIAEAAMTLHCDSARASGVQVRRAPSRLVRLLMRPWLSFPKEPPTGPL
jgi:hypothetical protein